VSQRPTELKLTLAPQRRFEAIDVNRRIGAEAGDVLNRHRRALYCSFHTTAGYLDQSLSARMHHRKDLLSQFFRAFHALFPQGVEYHHDRMELRSELTDEQKIVEPRNADSHLTYIGSGMRNCVTYRSRPDAPVYFIELDGLTEAMHPSTLLRAHPEPPPGIKRQRTTKIVAYDEERVVARVSLRVPVSKHPVDSINLADPRLGLIASVNDLLARAGLQYGRVDLLVDPAERHVGLTVNEYETLLMKNDLADVLRDPMHFARLKARSALNDPLSIPGKTLNYAKYDGVRVFNSLMEALRLDEGSLERLIAKVMSLPARRFVRSRRVSFLASGDGAEGQLRLLRGTYQSPILVQWQSPERRERCVNIVLSELS
jgi:thiamine phosphate synthase YjbQ (UPF0047 family)